MHRHIIPDVISGQHVCIQLATNTAFEAAEEMVACDIAGIVVVDPTESSKVSSPSATSPVASWGKNWTP